MAHTIRLVDGTTYSVESTEIVGSHLEIKMSTLEKSVENIETIFDNQASNLARIGLEQPEGDEYGHFSNFTKYGGIFKDPDSDTATVYLIQPVDDTEQRITTAESVSAEAKVAASEAKSTAESAISVVSEVSGKVTQAQELVQQANEYAQSAQSSAQLAESSAQSATEKAQSAVDQASQSNKFVSAAYVVAKKQAQSLTDQEALQAKILYDEWVDLCSQSFKAEETGYKFVHTKDGTTELYKTMQQEFTFQSQWEPGSQGTESLYSHIDEAHAGTQEDPIPYKKNMEIFEGKYYTQNDVLYICTRSSGIPLQYDLADVTPHFVSVVE